MNDVLFEEMKKHTSRDFINNLLLAEINKKYSVCRICNSDNLLYISRHIFDECRLHSSTEPSCQKCVFNSYDVCLSCILWEDYGFAFEEVRENRGCHHYVICDDCLEIQEYFPIKPAHISEEYSDDFLNIHSLKECPVCNNSVCMQNIICSGCNTFRVVCKSGDLYCCKKCERICTECS